MNRNLFFVGIALLITSYGLTHLASAKDRPNIILMMADDMGWGDAGYMGNKVIKTPHLDSMAASGLRFNRFYAAAPVCSPTRGSCLTGRHPYRYGIFFANTGHMLKQEITLAEILQKDGYTTGHFGKWHLGTLTKTEKDANRGGPGGAAHLAPPHQHGFDANFSTESKVPTWDPMWRPKTVKGKTWWDPLPAGADPAQGGTPYGTSYWSHGKKVIGNMRGDDSRVIVDRAIPFIETAVKAKKPFFAVIWFHTPHLPVVSGPKYTKPYAQFSKHKQHYLGCITAMDEQIGRLRQALKDSGTADNTMLWFCSDNGPEGGNSSPGSAAHLRGRKRSLFEGGVRVPGILQWPAKIKTPRTTELPAVTSDYLPTILDMLALKMPDNRPIDGVSLMPLIEGKMTQRPKPIAFESKGVISLVDNRYKIIRVPASNSAKGKKGKKKEKPATGVKSKDSAQFMLFDLSKDASEKTDIAGQHPEIVKKMSATLEQWRQSVKASGAGKDY